MLHKKFTIRKKEKQDNKLIKLTLLLAFFQLNKVKKID